MILGIKVLFNRTTKGKLVGDEDFNESNGFGFSAKTSFAISGIQR